MSRIERVITALESVDNPTWLQGWYLAMCDGDWEHQEGIKINTLDNPGWSLHISLHATYLEELEFERIQINRSEHDWIHCERKSFGFEGHGGPLNLNELIGIFRNWATPTLTVNKAADYGVNRGWFDEMEPNF